MSGQDKRIDAMFTGLKQQGRAGLGIFITAGDPNLETSAKILAGLPGAGADMIEFGMPFSDPMADGPAIQASSLRSLKAGGTLQRTLDMVRTFREQDQTTPIILMGYFNPIFIYGVDRFLDAVQEVGADGLIVVDLPPEEDVELCLPAVDRGLSFIRLATPTTDEARLPAVLTNTSGFIYYVSITGVTGTASVPTDAVRRAVERFRAHTDLPVAVGFGIKTAADAATVARAADAAIVGSAVVSKIVDSLDADGAPGAGTVEAVLLLVRELADGVRHARD